MSHRITDSRANGDGLHMAHAVSVHAHAEQGALFGRRLERFVSVHAHAEQGPAPPASRCSDHRARLSVSCDRSRELCDAGHQRSSSASGLQHYGKYEEVVLPCNGAPDARKSIKIKHLPERAPETADAFGRVRDDKRDSCVDCVQHK